MHSDLLDTILVGRKDANNPDGGAMKDAAPGEEAKCPVDHKTRETWLRQARAMQPPNAPDATSGDGATAGARARAAVQQQQQQNKAAAITSASATPAEPSSSPSASSSPSSWSWSSWSMPAIFTTSPASSHDAKESPSTAATSQQPQQQTQQQQPGLPTSRAISTIPRTSNPGPASCPANHEQETGASASGHWIYPSERMFFEALRRKGYTSAAAADMATVVPIHNAVNERAWAEILAWERPYAQDSQTTCGGPRLHSFAGRSERMSPRARANTLLGYAAPFDRHDWVVDRCGTRVDYVIDFYAGRPGGKGSGPGKLNFYLDVRPKLNTWEGVRMRVLRGLGVV